MITIKDHNTKRFFDPWDHMGPKRRKRLEEEWPGLFRQHILPVLPVEELARHFHQDMGRPTKELFTMMGAVLLQQIFDLTDKQTVDAIAFDIQWHYALDISDESDDAKYISEKTLWTIRIIMAKNGIDKKMFDIINDKLAEVFGVDLSKQRIDSVHFESNMKHLTRIGIFVKTINKFLKNLKRQHSGLYKKLPEELLKKYNTKKGLGCFAMIKPKQSKKTLQSVAENLYDLTELFCDNNNVRSMSSFKLLLRVLHEQCNVSEPAAGEPIEVTPKANKEISSDSLQNPSDPDAGYDSHKGKGYQAQVMETYSETEDPDEKEQQLNLITYIEVEAANEHDANALLPALESTAKCGLGPDEVLADSAYGGHENVEAAKAKGVEVVSPAMGTREQSAVELDDFSFDDEGDVTCCPAGHAPAKIKQNKNKKSVAFDLEFCTSCPHQNHCLVKPGKKFYYLHYDEKDRRLSARRAAERTFDFKDRYRWRAGVEATMSEFDRLTGIKHLRVRGRTAVNFAIRLKATGLNILRATRVRKARIAAGTWPTSAILREFLAALSFKERFVAAFTIFVSNLPRFIFSGGIHPEKIGAALQAAV
jgi:hypothetical protein